MCRTTTMMLVLVIIVTLNQVAGIIILIKIPRGMRQNSNVPLIIRPVQIAMPTAYLPNYQS